MRNLCIKVEHKFYKRFQIEVVQLNLLTSFYSEFSGFIIINVLRLIAWNLLLYSANYDICFDLKVARKCILDNNRGLEIDIKASCMLGFLLFNDGELVSMIQICLNRDLSK
jgi:hypothetical protein